MLRSQLGALVDTHNQGFNNVAETVNRLFGFPRKGLTRDMFIRRLVDLGIPVTTPVADALYDEFDTANTGRIPLYSLVRSIQQADYTAPTWSAKVTAPRFFLPISLAPILCIFFLSLLLPAGAARLRDAGKEAICTFSSFDREHSP